MCCWCSVELCVDVCYVDDEKGISLLTVKTDSLAFALAVRPSL
jgi:hypothetical protein